MPQKRLKVLMCCYACEPDKGSEQGVGWKFAKNIARYHDVHVLVEENKFRESLERFAKDHPDEVSHLTFHFIPRLRLRFLRKIWPPSYYWTYRLWHRKALALAIELHQREHFDLVHHVTLAGYREPGFLWKLGVPFVWGPVGGLNNTPWCLLSILGVKGAFFYAMRNIINFWQKHWGYAARVVAPRAASIMTSTEEGAAEVRRIWKHDAIAICEIGCWDVVDVPVCAQHQLDEPLKLCWVGALNARKALPFLLRALPLCDHPMELHIVGKGELRAYWERLAKNLCSKHNVIFHGQIPHAEVASIMASCHVQCITSVRDDTSTVTLEAMQLGVPVVTLDHCGFATVIDDTCGIKIPITDKKHIIKAYADALNRLAENENYRRKLCFGAVERAKKFTWEEKIRILLSQYKAAVCKDTQ